MRVYFPQWQGAGTGKGIEAGAATIRHYLSGQDIVELPLTPTDTDQAGEQRFGINNFDAIYQQLLGFKSFLAENAPKELRVIGGDCGLEIVPVSYLNVVYPNLGVIWFDAHADINTPDDSPSHNFHGMPLRTLLGEGAAEMDQLLFSKLKATQIHYLGLRDMDPAEQQRLEAGNIYYTQEIGIQELIRVLKEKHIQQLYLHFDCDCLDPNAYQKTYYEVPNGIRVQEAQACIAALSEAFEVVGSSFLESIATNTEELQPVQPLIDVLLK